MRNKAVGIFFLVAVSWLFLATVEIERNPVTEFSRYDYAKLVVDYGAGRRRMFHGPVTENMTILQALYGASLGGNFEVRYSVDQKGRVELAAIDRVIDLGVNTWRFRLNGQTVSTADLDRVVIRRGDLIEAKFE